MRDTTYFRQIPKYTIQPESLTNHLMHPECITENCIVPLSKDNLESICTKQYDLSTCQTIGNTCNNVCFPLTRACANTDLNGKMCIEYINDFTKLT